METARTNDLFIGARVIYKRRDVRYVGQIIDRMKRYEEDTRSEYFTYVVKFDNEHSFCRRDKIDNRTRAVYKEVLGTELTLSAKQYDYCSDDMIVTISGKVAPKDVCNVVTVNGNEVYFTIYDLNNYFVCEHCQQIYNISEKVHIEDESVHICKHCISEMTEYSRCDRCNSYYRNEDIVHMDDGANVCGNCFRNHYSVISCYHTYKSEATDDGYEYYGDTHNNAVPYMGFELETENEDEDSKSVEVCAYKAQKVFGDIYVATEEDGSLDYGFELITPPMTYEYHNTINDKYINLMDLYSQFGMVDTDNCGLHVHINRNYFDDVDNGILNILTIFDKFWDNIKIFSRRDIERLGRWAKKPAGTPEQILRESKGYVRDRYVAVNLTNTHTIEFRIFKSTTDWEILRSTLSLINNIAIISKYMSNSDIIDKLTWEDLTSEDFSHDVSAGIY